MKHLYFEKLQLFTRKYITKKNIEANNIIADTKINTVVAVEKLDVDGKIKSSVTITEVVTVVAKESSFNPEML